MIVADLLGIHYEKVPVKLEEGEHKKEPFLKINPQAEVPALSDGDDFNLSESNAIIRYLVAISDNKESSLYPTTSDLKRRAQID